MDEELREAARAYSRAVDAWNRSGEGLTLHSSERNMRSARAFSRMKAARDALAQAGRRFAQSEG